MPSPFAFVIYHRYSYTWAAGRRAPSRQTCSEWPHPYPYDAVHKTQFAQTANQFARPDSRPFSTGFYSNVMARARPLLGIKPGSHTRRVPRAEPGSVRGSYGTMSEDRRRRDFTVAALPSGSAKPLFRFSDPCQAIMASATRSRAHGNVIRVVGFVGQLHQKEGPLGEGTKLGRALGTGRLSSRWPRTAMSCKRHRTQGQGVSDKYVCVSAGALDNRPLHSIPIPATRPSVTAREELADQSPGLPSSERGRAERAEITRPDIRASHRPLMKQAILAIPQSPRRRSGLLQAYLEKCGFCDIALQCAQKVGSGED